jgi:hypothetical protein
MAIFNSYVKLPEGNPKNHGVHNPKNGDCWNRSRSAAFLGSPNKNNPEMGLGQIL